MSDGRRDGWDLAGAAASGMHTGFVLRSREALYPLAPAPDLVAKDLLALSTAIEQLPSA